MHTPLRTLSAEENKGEEREKGNEKQNTPSAILDTQKVMYKDHQINDN